MRGVFTKCILLVFLVLIGLLPTLASTAFGKDLLFNWVKKRTNLEITASEFSLSWWGPQQAEGLIIKDPQRGAQLNVEEISSGCSLFRLLATRGSCTSIEAKEASFSINAPDAPSLRLNQMVLSLNWPSHLFLSGSADQGTFDVRIQNASSSLQAEAHLKSFPLTAVGELLALFIPEKAQVIPLLFGPTLDLDLSLTTQEESRFLSLEASSPLFFAKVQTPLKEGNVIVLSEPAQLRFTCTPELIQALKLPPLFQEQATVLITLRSFDAALTHAAGAISVDDLSWKNPYLDDWLGNSIHANYQLHSSHLNLHFELPQSNGSQPVRAAIELTLQPPFTFRGSVEPISLSDDVQLKGCLLQGSYEASKKLIQGKLDIETLAGKTSGVVDAAFQITAAQTEASLQIDRFPSSVLSLLIPEAKLLGPLIQAKGHCLLKEGSGPLELQLYTSHSRLSCEGVVEKGIFHLKQPLYAQLQLTPELAPLLLKEVNPLSIPNLSSEDPLTIEIAAAGSAIPLLDYDPKLLSLSSITLELGQIICDNAGALQFTLGLLKQPLSSSPQLHLWFAPAALSIQEGIVSIERTEILIDRSLEICSWGTIDLPRDRVDMVLGLTAQTLKKAFGIKNLPADYVLQLPMRGSLSNVKLDTGKATAKIAALLLWQKGALAGAVGGGLPGAIAGELIGKLATLPDRDSKAPPAKHPFPWEGKKGKRETSQKERGTKFKKEKEGALSVLQLFDQLF